MPAIGLALVSMVGVAACGGSSDSTTNTGGSSSGATNASVKLNLVGYSTPEKAYDALTAAFAKTSAGKGVGFADSFGSSGSQSRAVDSGQAADVVAFSTTPDMTRLVGDKIVAPNWAANSEKGFSSDSVVVFVVRKGNPKHISTLERPDQARRRRDHAEPVDVGQRPLEHPGRLRRRAQAGQVAGRRARLPEDADDQERLR